MFKRRPLSRPLCQAPRGRKGGQYFTSARIGVQLCRPHVVDVLLESIGVGLQLCLCALFCPNDGSLDFLAVESAFSSALVEPIVSISFFTSSLATTFPALPYSVAVNCKTLISSPSSHLRSVAFPHIAEVSPQLREHAEVALSCPPCRGCQRAQGSWIPDAERTARRPSQTFVPARKADDRRSEFRLGFSHRCFG